jgi:hypothetical protein
MEIKIPEQDKPNIVPMRQAYFIKFLAFELNSRLLTLIPVAI